MVVAGVVGGQVADDADPDGVGRVEQPAQGGVPTEQRVDALYAAQSARYLAVLDALRLDAASTDALRAAVERVLTATAEEAR